MNAAAPPAPCPCSLIAAAERLLGKVNEKDRALLEEMDAADANAPIFEAHMAFEEQVIGPHMTRGDLYKLRAEHAYIRRFRRRGIVVPARFVQLHAAWEKKIFPTIGAPGGAPAPS